MSSSEIRVLRQAVYTSRFQLLIILNMRGRKNVVIDEELMSEDFDKTQYEYGPSRLRIILSFLVAFESGTLWIYLMWKLSGFPGKVGLFMGIFTLIGSLLLLQLLKKRKLYIYSDRVEIPHGAYLRKTIKIFLRDVGKTEVTRDRYYSSIHIHNSDNEVVSVQQSHMSQDGFMRLCHLLKQIPEKTNHKNSTLSKQPVELKSNFFKKKYVVPIAVFLASVITFKNMYLTSIENVVRAVGFTLLISLLYYLFLFIKSRVEVLVFKKFTENEIIEIKSLYREIVSLVIVSILWGIMLVFIFLKYAK